jgi:hypothetical protein
VDLWVLNVAGAEHEILQSLDLQEFGAKVLVLGASGDSGQASAASELLHAAGYQRVEAAGQGQDDSITNKDAALPPHLAVFVHRDARKHLKASPGTALPMAVPG